MARSFVLAGVAATAAACSDAPLVAPVSTGPAAAVYVPFKPSANGDTVSASFVVNPSASETYYFPGGHRVQIVANSVCDPATTAYGPQHWDEPCATITRPITFKVKSWLDKSGHPRIRISPDVRFAPGKVNSLWFNDASSSWTSNFIAWCATGSPKCINEAKTDPTAATTTDAATGLLKRRVKHFSGYTIAAD